MNRIVCLLTSCLRPTNSFVSFLLVGLVNTLAGLTLMFFMANILGVSYWVSTLTGNVCGAVLSFFLNKTFTFDNHSTLRASMPRFIMVISICYVCSYKTSSLIIEAMIGRHQLPLMLDNDNLSILLGTGIYAVSNYMGQKHFVFHKSKSNLQYE
ncbi:GtrA family protein [Peribacillus sp. SCS-155]|uniref:GtrA family protein n=1 Tax=Peribacillus sedimenti TaxID=3115297 RepID=UPI003905DC1A